MVNLEKLLEQAKPQRSVTIDLASVRDQYSRYVEQYGRIYPRINEILAGLTQQIFRAFGTRIDGLIEAMPVEQKVETLARDLGWRQARHLSEWRKAKGTLPSFGNLVRMAVLQDLSLNWLLFGQGPKYLSEISGTPVDKGATKGVTSAVDDYDETVRQAMHILGKGNVKHLLVTAMGKIDGRHGRDGGLGAKDHRAGPAKRTRGSQAKTHRKA